MKTYDFLPKPFFVLAPMDDVTDTVFRQIVADCGAPDLFFTEFVNVDGLQSVGREKLLKRIRFSANEKPIVAQIWGKKPENFYRTTKELIDMGFAGVDLNMGCPEKTVVRNGCCSALINNRELALDIIQATKDGASGKIPVSVKTRLGFSNVDFSWHEFLLSQGLSMLTVHGRTRKQMSAVPADWGAIEKVRQLRDEIAPQTLLVGNGDVCSHEEGLSLAREHGIDGIMIGRGIFQDPFVFNKNSDWEKQSKQQRVELYVKQVQLFAETWQNNERQLATLNKFCKVYINGFDGAKELRDKLMHSSSTDGLLNLLKSVKV